MPEHFGQGYHEQFSSGHVTRMEDRSGNNNPMILQHGLFKFSLLFAGANLRCEGFPTPIDMHGLMGLRFDKLAQFITERPIYNYRKAFHSLLCCVSFRFDCRAAHDLRGFPAPRAAGHNPLVPVAVRRCRGQRLGRQRQRAAVLLGAYLCVFS